MTMTDHSTLKHMTDLVHRETITTFLRVVSIALSIALFLMGYDPLVSGRPMDGAYARPVFDGVYGFASPTAWGLMFVTCSLLMMMGGISGRAAVYVIGALLSTVTLAAWAGMLILEDFTNPDAELTRGAYGLYVLAFTALLGIAWAPHQIIAHRELVSINTSNEPAITVIRSA